MTKPLDNLETDLNDTTCSTELKTMMVTIFH